jgi:hypothetical protein
MTDKDEAPIGWIDWHAASEAETPHIAVYRHEGDGDETRLMDIYVHDGDWDEAEDLAIRICAMLNERNARR